MVNNRQQELLVVLSEESAEVSQAVSKILRFGFDTTNPYTKCSNREQLETELGDLVCLMAVLVEEGYLDFERIQTAAEAKKEKLERFLSY